LQPFPGADIWDIIYYIDAGIVKVNYDIMIATEHLQILQSFQNYLKA
jgi:hypothetical protein